MAVTRQRIWKGVRRRRRRFARASEDWTRGTAARLRRWRETAPQRLAASMWDGDSANYGVWTEQPLVFFIHDGIHTDVPKSNMSPLFEGLGERRSWFLVTHRWDKENQASVQRILDWERQHNSSHPGHHFVHLCNTHRQTELFTSAGLDAVFCNHNALVDEHIFQPDAQVSVRFDSLYDARFTAFKRHHLASEVGSLALTYTQHWTQRWPLYEWRSRRKLRRAHDFNRDDGTGRYRALTEVEIADRIRACRVGLILSAEEGGNYASIQYLLCGLGVVSTKSRGGRDVFFDSTTALIVDDTAAAVSVGVDEMKRWNLDPNQVRATTMKLVTEHRDRLLHRLQQVYDSEGVDRSARADWDHRFFHKMLKPQSHAAVLAALEMPDG